MFFKRFDILLYIMQEILYIILLGKLALPPTATRVVFSAILFLDHPITTMRIAAYGDSRRVCCGPGSRRLPGPQQTPLANHRRWWGVL